MKLCYHAYILINPYLDNDMANQIFTIKPKFVTKKFLTVLPERSRTIITKRFGLGDSPDRLTLEAIGDSYGITRERVRQVENHALETMRKSDVFAREEPTFNSLYNTLDTLGAIVSEEEFLTMLARDPGTQNHIYLLLNLGDKFTREKEDDHFVHRWHINEGHAEVVHKALKGLASDISEEDLIPDAEIVPMFMERLHTHGLDKRYDNNDTARRWLNLSKAIGRNPLGEWGLASSPSIKVKGIRDYAYLALRLHGSPMHFTEIAKAIGENFSKQAHVATCHNELIKDGRFVLVGRGLYALVEWGYMGGVVRDVIAEIIKRNGPMSRHEIVDKVLKERYVKENTIVVNLEDDAYFKKNEQGKYMVK